VLLSATDDNFSTVANLRIKRAELVEKPTLGGHAYKSVEWHEALKKVVTVPPLMDDEAVQLVSNIDTVRSSTLTLSVVY
jgi:hypothetical protein